ncbi:family 43 glycosylhydrolase [Occultella aeris]|uniref:Intracellular endo-alpha-(1->5)-L-arabinanase n=1 Tax=Occultella aeris TaxID=2761496 RepID=A0A7M4DR96_9MICO|nr:family 43 glycosylhydrolase [Occultella aeris]VZO39990.1 Intracellular endo-alpha-(1->5)-L-arabinanase [Occultella aeris]
MRPCIRAVLAAAASLCLLGSGLQAATAGPAPSSSAPPAVTVTNPISDEFSDTYADPAIIRGKDGYWYMYATSDPLTEAPSPFGLMHIARSHDFSSWEYLGTVFDDETRPDWATSGSFLWAPDIRYVAGEYVLYYTVTDTVADPGGSNYAIGAATAPTPAGPWTDSGAAVVEPRSDGGDGYFNTIDPALFVDDDGVRYLYFGGYHGGLWVTELDESGLTAVGEPTRVARPDRYEGSFVVKRDGYYYLTASSANCCAGPVTGYSVYAGRSTSPRGPFVDHEGVSLLDSRVGGTQVLAQNGNSIIGVGHHAIFTDTSGQDWILYHGIERDDAWLDAPGGVNERPTFVDRLDWIDGWPVANAGAGPTEGSLTGPVTGSALGIDQGDPAANQALRATAGTWHAAVEDLNDAGGVGVLDSTGEAARVVSNRPTPRDVRVEADVRFLDDAQTFAVGLAQAGRNAIAVTVDRTTGELRAEVTQGARTTVEAAPLTSLFSPDAFTSVTVEARDGVLRAVLSESRLGDVLAEVEIDLPRGAQKQRPVELASTGGAVQVDNLSVVAAHTPATERVAEPEPGSVLFAEEFDGDLQPGWEWVRPATGTTVTDAQLQWPLESVDIVGEGNTGALLLRDAPEGEWIMQTRVTLDLGVDTIRNYQQAGLIVHNSDDDFLRLGTVAIWSSRQAEFGKELVEDGRFNWGAHLGGPVAPTIWLQLHHTVDPATGDLLYRSATSRDGQSWRWGATWTLPAGSDPRIGLYAGGGAAPPAVATFDYVRVFDVR